ncbi:hypothetical protein Pmani_001728, partial [Petrolisthes manimaculis]
PPLPITTTFNNNNNKRRVRRYLYSSRYSIEVMVVVDNKMAQYHGRHVTQYVLTLMSVVALIFRDATIGHHIDIAVVEVMREDREFITSKRGYENGSEAPTGKSAEEMLKGFCKWQQLDLKRNPTHPRRFDTALLLTRENICRNPWTKSCDTLGLAELGTMCSRHASCAIVQDNGLSAAFTIAHELGHLLNMPHDNDVKCALLGELEESNQEEPTKMNVMSRMLDHNTLPWEWSNCSRRYLTDYLHGGHGACLEDEPWTNKLIETESELTLAGELFNASKQCQYVFGLTSRICPYMPTCKRLWCTTSVDEKEGCRTQHMPWADGTHCDTNSWCLRGKCVPKDKNVTKKIHGNWGEWLAWSTCSRTCGVGVRSSTRHCNSPPPSHGGQYCTGERVRYESCIMKQCPHDAVDFRTQQCQAYNGKTFGLSDIPEDVIWVPKYSGISREDSCQLFCQVFNYSHSSYFKLRDKVDDGTTCGPDSNDICVNGKCHMAGCDYVLNSTTKADTCGVCNGDNSTCELSSGSFDHTYPYGYSDIFVIPEGAARIEITQRAYHNLPSDDNYLALVEHESGNYLLNGGSVVTPFPKLVNFGGTLLEYSGSSSSVERINSTKPLSKKLLVQILSVGDLNPPYIKYSYTKSSLHTNPNFFWRLGDWTNCSDSCDGEQTREPYCVRADSGNQVGDELCPSHARPVTHRQPCTHTCPAAWHYTDWSKCVLNGERCYRERKVVDCVSSLGESVSRERCEGDQQYTILDCPSEECATWSYAEWSPCLCKEGESVGLQQRLYSCLLRERSVSAWECRHLGKPEHTHNCSCWVTSSWSKWCDVGGVPSPSSGAGIGRGEECGTGVRLRKVTCGLPSDPEPPENCSPAPKPTETDPCHIPCTPSTTTTSTTTTTTTPPSSTPSTTTTYITSVTLTLPTYPPDKHSISDFSPAKNKGGKQHPDQSNTLDRTHQHHHHHHRNNPRRPKTDHSKYDVSYPWHQPYSRGTDRRRPKLHDTETNEISNALPTGYDDIGGQTNFERISDNQLDGEREEERHSGRVRGDRREERSRGEGRGRGGRNNKEENNNVVTNYSPPTSPPDPTTSWHTGGWSTCSNECGGGEKRRQVVCGSDGGGHGCLEDQRPQDTAPCNTHACTEWSVGDWGQCRVRQRCGRGRQQRLVVCRDPNGPTLDDRLCDPDDRPTHFRRCKIPCSGNRGAGRRRGERQRYKWRAGQWSPFCAHIPHHKTLPPSPLLPYPSTSTHPSDTLLCSEPCDRGVSFRNVSCRDTQMRDAEVHFEYCRREGLPMRKLTRRCNKHPCPFRWSTSHWSECSEVCGPGTQMRDVTCHIVNRAGWQDPQPVEQGCNETKQPRHTRRCNMGPCQHGFFWRVKPWKQCQGECGRRGRQRRGVHCVNMHGQRVARRHCSRDHRPRRKQKCRVKPCGFTSCIEVREAQQVSLDGEYSLYVGGRNMSIFCRGMNTNTPTEYLTLPAGEEGNFAEIYNKILIQPDTCPYGGERRDQCECVRETGRHSGYTAFSKIRFNTTTLIVNTYDFTYAQVVSGNPVRYGEAGDCYSTAGCPQGAFSINLAGTELVVAKRTTWTVDGNQAAKDIKRLDGNQRILGRCGGYCGTCGPDPTTGLKLSLAES